MKRIEFNHLYKEMKSIATTKYGGAGFREADNTLRYSLTREYLENLYKEIEDFVADIKWEEYEIYKDSIQSFQTLLHHHINSPLTPRKVK